MAALPETNSEDTTDPSVHHQAAEETKQFNDLVEAVEVWKIYKLLVGTFYPF